MSTPSSPAVATPPPLRASKRKRAEVSYLDEDHYAELDAIQDDEGLEYDGAGFIEDDEDEDVAFRPGRKVNVKTRSAKRAKKAPKPKKEKPQKPFRFLDLPAELRDEIYELALTEPNGLTLISKTKLSRRTIVRGPISIQNGNYYYGRARRRRYWNRVSQTSVEHTNDRHLVPNLLAVNKQIRNEASSYLYKQEIVLEDTTALFTFIAKIGSYNQKLLNDIVIRGWGEGRGIHRAHNYTALTMLASCTNLDSLYFDCSIGWRSSAKSIAGQMYRDGAMFLEAYASVNGVDSAVKVLQFSDWVFDKHQNRFGVRMDEDIPPEFDQKKRDEFETELRRLMKRGSGMVAGD